jgi:hypothetical protein
MRARRSRGRSRLAQVATFRMPRRTSHSAKPLNTPENVRTATRDRQPLGSRMLAPSLNLADAPSRLTFSRLTLIGMFRGFAA